MAKKKMVTRIRLEKKLRRKDRIDVSDVGDVKYYEEHPEVPRARCLVLPNGVLLAVEESVEDLQKMFPHACEDVG